MSEVSRTNEAERVEFSRLSIIRLKAYSARKEGGTDPQAGIVTAIAESSRCFIVWYCKAVNGWSATRSCEWVGSPLKRRRKVPCKVVFALSIALSHGTFIRRLSEARYTPIRCTARVAVECRCPQKWTVRKIASVRKKGECATYKRAQVHISNLKNMCTTHIPRHIHY